MTKRLNKQGIIEMIKKDVLDYDSATDRYVGSYHNLDQMIENHIKPLKEDEEGTIAYEHYSEDRNVIPFFFRRVDAYTEKYKTYQIQDTDNNQISIYVYDDKDSVQIGIRTKSALLGNWELRKVIFIWKVR